ncbi:NADAR family protein [Flavobacterium ginsenosidimutans]|uniref:NADAR family protein n=1 Tax=Flavobacterium ginsenosidimutans TaxID=687844 RepID=A0ABZ2QCJ8_9FLAO|nr:NADAR family protein [Flavobacterium ginsenosidimutans]KAF2331198.1 NADAR family protein [Flavobacterium ginsenosidimutans]
MKYNIGDVVPESKFLFFWGHQPDKSGKITKTCFSQWWLSSFKVDKVTYKTAEHWMMAKKAELFQDQEILEKILEADSPAEAKKLGREVRNYDDKVWLENRYEIVKEGNYHKFSQNADLKTFLLNTKERVIVEASPVDPIWGIGMASDHKDVLNPKAWKGLNLLGFALMEVRDELK